MDLIERVKGKGLLLDGAMGSMLINKGLRSDEIGELWNLEKPELIQQIHREYIGAGAEVITTNTFGATRGKLQRSGLEKLVERINRSAVQIARKAAGFNILVAGNVGPTGELLEPFGTVSKEEADSWFSEQITYLVDEGVDLILIETMYHLQEALIAVKAARRLTTLPVFISMTFDYKGGRYVTVMGDELIASLHLLLDAGADVVGVNCTLSSVQMVQLASELRQKLSGLLLIQPNAGQPELQGANLVYPESPEFFAENLLRIKTLGIEVIGGCCGTNPLHIKAVAEKLSPLKGVENE